MARPQTKILKLDKRLPFLADQPKDGSKPSLILGLSGGPDSMALWHLLENHPQRKEFRLILAHLNHMFRGQEADEEEATLEEMVQSGQIYLEDDSFSQLPIALATLFRSKRIDVSQLAQERKLSSQDAGHQARREFFISLAQEFNTSHLALAHHRDDRAESFFIHLLHGAGVQGLSAMPQEDHFEGLTIWRPLISFSKEDILHYCQAHELTYFTDPSNKEALYLRNKIRLELIPLLERDYNPEIVASLARTMEILQEEDAYLDGLAQKDFQELLSRMGTNGYHYPVGKIDRAKKIQMSKNDFTQLAPARQRRLLLEILKRLDAAYTFEKIERMRDLLLEERGQRSYRLSGDWIMRISYDQVDFLFSKQEDQEAGGQRGDALGQAGSFADLYPQGLSLEEVELRLRQMEADGGQEGQPGAQLRLPHGQAGQILLDLSTVSTLSTSLVQTESSVPQSLIFRNRLPGDFIKIANRPHKKLKNFLIDEKIPRQERDQLLLLARGKEILWIPGLAISEKFLGGIEFEKKLSM